MIEGAPSSTARLRGRMAALLLVPALAGGVAVARGEDRPAVELYNPAPRFPPQAGSAGVVPEVTVEVNLDENGRVAEVRVVDIRPSTELDFVFEDAVVSAVSTWRYAPRIEDGVPVATTLRWTQSLFEPGYDSSRRMSDRDWWDAVLGLERSGDRRFVEMPLEDRGKLLEEQVRVGTELLDAGGLKRAVTDNVVVHTDAGAETDRVVAHNVEAAYGLLSSVLGRGIPLEPEELKLQVLVFSDADSYRQFQARAFTSENLFAGFYCELGVVAFHLEVPSPDDALAVLLHEATHAFVDRHLLRPGVSLPVWLTEGLAEYISNSEVKKGELVPGRIRRTPTRRYVMTEGRVLTQYGGVGTALTLADIRRAARRGEALTLAEMLDADYETFHGEAQRFYYGVSGLVVHFLRHGRPEWEETAFPSFLLYVAEGFPPSAALEAAYGTTPEALEEAFRMHVAES